MEYEDGSKAVIQSDNSVMVTDHDGDVFIVSGFPTRSDARNFIMFGDLETHGKDNDFITITNPDYELYWKNI